MSDDSSQEEKQNFLRENILEKGYDTNMFVEFLINKKGEGGSDVGNWSMSDLQIVVREFISMQSNDIHPPEEEQPIINNNSISTPVQNDPLSSIPQNPIHNDPLSAPIIKNKLIRCNQIYRLQKKINMILFQEEFNNHKILKKNRLVLCLIFFQIIIQIKNKMKIQTQII